MTYEYRLATTDDAEAILAALDEVASEIPLSLHLPGRKELLLERIKAGDTWIALDHNHEIVGFCYSPLITFTRSNSAMEV